MESNRTNRNELLAKRIIKGLESRNMEGHYTASKAEALTKALEIINEGSSVAWGGSMSIAEIGLKDVLKEGNYTVYDRESCKDPDEKRKIELATYDTDYYLTSANAITEDGEIVNVDGIANRVSAIAFGPRNVVMIVGMNKAVKTLEDAMSRSRNEAAPINAQRFGLETPCSKNGMCFDCKSPDSICCQILTTRFSRIPNRIKVILVNDTLGF